MPLLSLFGELETFIADDLYPHRYVITPVAIAVILGILFAAYRLGLHSVLWRHRAATAVIGAPLLAVTLVVGDYLVSPLWERSHLAEPSPLASGEPDSGNLSQPGAVIDPRDGAPNTASSSTSNVPDPPEPSFQPSILQSGEFIGADDFHFGHGTALLIETEPGRYVLRFEEFSVRNGPDLYVYLSTDPSGRSIDEALNLGELKATDGAFNYEVPPEIDLSLIKSAVVWCRQFSTLFTHAELM